jgi:hypothetical protein
MWVNNQGNKRGMERLQKSGENRAFFAEKRLFSGLKIHPMRKPPV